jgi:hypothetical protein
MLGPARRRLGLTRKDRRSPTSPILTTGWQGEEAEAAMDDRHLVGVMCIPSFRMAQYFSPATEKDRGVDYRFIIAERAEIPDHLKAVGVGFKASSISYGRMLAKIGLGLAVAQAGWDAFIPFVRGTILGTEEDIHRYVGGFCEEIPEPEKSDEFHKMSLNKHDGLLIAEIQLFAQYGGPRNYVIVGSLTENFVTSKVVRSGCTPRIRLS